MTIHDDIAARYGVTVPASVQVQIIPAGLMGQSYEPVPSLGWKDGAKQKKAAYDRQRKFERAAVAAEKIAKPVREKAEKPASPKYDRAEHAHNSPMIQAAKEKSAARLAKMAALIECGASRANMVKEMNMVDKYLQAYLHKYFPNHKWPRKNSGKRPVAQLRRRELAVKITNLMKSMSQVEAAKVLGFSGNYIYNVMSILRADGLMPPVAKSRKGKGVTSAMRQRDAEIAAMHGNGLTHGQIVTASGASPKGVRSSLRRSGLKEPALPKPEIPVDKIKALQAKGWSSNKIAVSLGMKRRTVVKHMIAA